MDKGSFFDLQSFLMQIYNGLDSIKLPLLGFTHFTLWKFLIAIFFIGFTYTIVNFLLDMKGGNG